MYRYLVFFYIFSAFLQPLQAQIFNYSGKVETELGLPLSQVVIKLSQNDKNHFAVSNALGAFNFSVHNFQNGESVEVEITHIGYQSILKKISIDLGTNVYQEIQLLPQIKSLQEVIVKPDIYINGDTTFINADAFRKKADNNLGDLLKNIPGFTNTPFGIIYNGKLIQEVYIENQKLSDNYLDLTTNLSAAIIAEVQVIENFNEIAALRGYRQSDESVLNLNLHKNKKLKASANINAGVGVVNKYAMDVSAILLKQKLKSLTLINANNVGFKPFNTFQVTKGLIDYNRNIFSDNRLYAYYQEPSFFSAEQYSNGVLPNNNQSRNVIQNIIFPLNKKGISLHINNGLYADKFVKQRETITTFYQNSALNYSENFNEIFSPTYFKTGAELVFNDSMFYAKLSGGFNSRNFLDKQNIISGNDYEQSNVSNKKSFQYSLYTVKKITDFSVVEALLAYNQQSVHQQLIIDNTTGVSFWDNIVTQRSQNLSINKRAAQSQINFYLKNRILKLIQLNYTFENYKPVSKAWAINTSQQKIDSFYYNTKLVKKEFELSTAGYYKIGKLKIDYKAGLFISSLKKGKQKSKPIYPIANVTLQYKLNYKSEIGAIINITKPNFLISNLTPVWYLASYRSINFAHPSQYYNSGTNYSLNYKKSSTSLASIFFVNLNVQVNNPTNINRATSYSPGIFLSELNTVVQRGNNSESAFVQYSGRLKKRKVNIRANFSGSRSKIFYDINSFTHQLNFRAELLLNKNFNDYVHIEGGVTFTLDQLVRNRQKNNQIYPIIEISSKSEHSINYSISYKPIFIYSGLSASYYQGLNGSLIFSPKKGKSNFKLVCENAIKQNYLLQATTNPLYNIVNKDFVLQRYFLLQFSKMLK